MGALDRIYFDFCKEDGIHFNSASYREFGKRYFKTHLEVIGK